MNFDYTKLTDVAWISVSLVIIILIASGFIIHFLFMKILGLIISKSTKLTEHNLLKKMRYPSFLLVLLIVFHSTSTGFNLNQKQIKILDQFSNIFLIIGLGWLLVQLITYAKSVFLENYDVETKDNLKARKVYTQFNIIQRIINFTIVIVAVSLILLNFDSIKRLGLSLLASAGVAGLIIGFAAQKLIATVLAGLQIAITQPIRVEDVVIVEGEWGWIEEITLTYVVLRIWDKRRLIVPTTYFIEKPFQNWTRSTAEILGTVFIYTDYGVPFDALRDELTKILENDNNWDGKVNVLQVTNASEKTVEIRALMSAEDSPTAWDLRVSVREKLISFLQKNYPESLPKSRFVFENKSV